MVWPTVEGWLYSEGAGPEGWLEAKDGCLETLVVAVGPELTSGVTCMGKHWRYATVQRLLIAGIVKPLHCISYKLSSTPLK